MRVSIDGIPCKVGYTFLGDYEAIMESGVDIFDRLCLEDSEHISRCLDLIEHNSTTFAISGPWTVERLPD